MTLVDTNVVADVIGPELEWQAWSVGAIARCRQNGPLYVNELVFSELSARFDSAEEVQRVLADLDLSFERMPVEALFLAGQAYRRYRRFGGKRANVLPDFFVGAHAQVTGMAVLTRDVRPYRTYFPDVKLIAPEPLS